MQAASISGISGGIERSNIILNFDINSSQDLVDALSSAHHLFIHLFAGIDGASEAIHQLDPLSDAKVLHLWFESDPFCQTILRSRSDEWHRLVNLTDSNGLSSSVFLLSDDNWAIIRLIAHHGKHLQSIILIAGSPCQGFSKAKKFGKFRRKDSGEHGQKEGLPILRQ